MKSARTPKKLPPVAPLALACALALSVANYLPFRLWGNLYDPVILRYWAGFGLPIIGLAVYAATSSAPVFRDLPARGERLLLSGSPRTFSGVVVLLSTGLSLVLQATAFERSGSTSDEFALLWHAKVLSRGFLFLPPDSNPEFFAIDNVIDVGKWYSHFPIGGPAVLLPGVMLGVAWVTNPLLLGLATAGVYGFARSAFGELQGRSAALLFALTPGVLFMSATYMNHTPTLALAVGVMWALGHWDRATTTRARWGYLALSGAGIGLMATIRPLDALIVAVVAGAFELWVIRAQLSRAVELVGQSLAGTVAVLPLFLANARMNGSALRFGYDVSWGEGHRVGFHPDPQGGVHDLGKGVEFAVRYVSELNFSTLAWPVPLGALVIAGLLAMRSVTKWDALLFGLFAAQVAGYATYWGEGEFLGPRFLFTALPALVIIVIRACYALAARGGAATTRACALLVIACVAISWAVPRQPASVLGIHSRVAGLRRSLKVDIAAAVREAGISNALVFVREPASARIIRRLWGVGVPRDVAGNLLAASDACSVVKAVQAAEADSTGKPESRLKIVEQTVVRLTPGMRAIGTRDPAIRVASMESLTDGCKAELDKNDFVAASFGPALVLEDFDDSGRLAGDVIYAADLTDHNETLRRRFAGRSWYRLVLNARLDGSLAASVVRY